MAEVLQLLFSTHRIVTIIIKITDQNKETKIFIAYFLLVRVIIPRDEQGIKEFDDKEFLTRNSSQGKQGIYQF